MKKRQVVMLRRVDSAAAAGYGNSGGSPPPLPPPSNNNVVRYAECLKNHAANSGGYALDGCREFMASSGEGTTGALTCAACGCHRNFHRKKELVNAAPTR